MLEAQKRQEAVESGLLQVRDESETDADESEGKMVGASEVHIWGADEGESSCCLNMQSDKLTEHVARRQGSGNKGGDKDAGEHHAGDLNEGDNNGAGTIGSREVSHSSTTALTERR